MNTPIRFRHALVALAVASLLGLAACGGGSDSPVPVTDTTTLLQEKVKNIVVIYAENRSFDNLYGNFPGANGLSTVVNANGVPTAAYVAQKDRNGTTVLAT